MDIDKKMMSIRLRMLSLGQRFEEAAAKNDKYIYDAETIMEGVAWMSLLRDMQKDHRKETQRLRHKASQAEYKYMEMKRQYDNLVSFHEKE